MNYSNINKPWNPELDNLIRNRRNAWLKTTIKLNFKGSSFFKKEYLLYKRLKSEILLSREINKLPGLKYLNVKNHNQ